MKASKPSAARWNFDSFQHLEKPGGDALPALHELSTADSARPGPAAQPRQGERRGRGQQPGTAREGVRSPRTLPAVQEMPRANPAEPGPASRPLRVALHLQPRRSAQPCAEPTRPRLRLLPASAHHQPSVLAPAAARGQQQTLGLRGSLPRS